MPRRRGMIYLESYLFFMGVIFTLKGVGGQSGQDAEILVRVSLTISDPATWQVRVCRNSPERGSATESDWNRIPVQWDFRRKRRIRIFLTKEKSIVRIIAV